MGAGPISLDRLLASGLASSALPLVKPLAGCTPRSLAILARSINWAAPVAGEPVVYTRAGGAFVAGGGAGFRQPLAGAGAWRPAWRRSARCWRCSGRASWARTKSRRSTGSINAFPAGPDRAARAGTDRCRHRLQRQLARWFPPLESWSDAALADVPHVVMVGAGFGGLKAAHGLRLGSLPGHASSTSATITCFNRCCIKWLPPACRPPMSPPRSGRCSAISTMCGCCWVK
jgi:hypothetical protein